MRLAEKVAIVTGGAQGIGLAIARRYLAEGASVVVADVNCEALSAARRKLGGRSRAMNLDVTDQAAIERVVDDVHTEFGRIDVLVNNAAVFDLAPVDEVQRESFRRVFAVNVEGTFFMMQTAARYMGAGESRGKIINMASQAGRRGEALVSAYCASKAAVISLTQSAGLALARRGINVNAISPGVVDTPMWDEVDALFARYEHREPGEKKRLAGEAVPFGRMGVPDDHTGAAVFLASDESDYVVGQTLNVDGGNCLN